MDIKNFFTIVLKNAVNAVLTNGALMGMLPSVFTIHTVDGWINIGKLTLGVIGARELAVWIPIWLKWSTTNADPGVLVVQKPAIPEVKAVIEPKDPPKP